MKAVIYARFSTNKQQEQSIDGQVRACREYADRKGYTVVGTYADRAISGTVADRPQFQQMIADAKKRQFDFVLVWKLDRFSRNRYDSAIYKRELQKHGVKVLSVTESIGDGNESIILEAIIEAMAEQYSLQLAENVKRGMKEAARQGKHVGGVCAYGYRVENKRYVIDEDEATNVREMFSLWLNGYSVTEITKALNAKGRRMRGKPFQYDVVLRALQNRKYTGVLIYDDVEVDGAMPQIISAKTFQAAQDRFERKPKKVYNRAEYLLSGKVFCGECGKAMTGYSAKSHTGRKYNYYVCTCGKKKERKEELEQYAVEQARRFVLNEENFDYITKRITDEYNKTCDPDRIKAIRSRIKAIENAQYKLVDKLIDDDENVVKMAKKRFSDLSEELAELTETVDEMTSNPLKEKDVAAYLDSFCRQDDRKIIDAFINSLYVWDDKLVIYYNVKKDGGQVSYEQAAADRVRVNPNMVVCDQVRTNLFFGTAFIGLIMPRKAQKPPRRRKKNARSIS